MHARLASSVLLFTSLVLVTSASAGYTFNTVPAPGGFIQACAGPATPGSAPWPGDDFTALFTAPGSDVDEQAFTGSSSASASAQYSAPSYANSASGQTGFGYASLVADNNAPNSSQFAAANANGGWSDFITVSHPSLNGQTGFMQFTLDANGTLFASGFAGSASLTVTGYKDSAQLQQNGFFSPGNSDPIGTDRQYGHWAIATYGNPPTDGKTVDGTVTFAVPITFGTPFKLGIYAAAKAGMRSSSGVPGNSTAQSHFGGAGLTWGGVTNVFHNGAPISGFTISSTSGTNWNGPIGPPIPGDLNGDGLVNGSDLAIVLGAWGTPGGDLNGDGTTDGADIAIVLGNWT